MKRNLLVKIISSLVIISFLHNVALAQVTSNYVLTPGPTWTLPTGSTMDLSIIWIDPDGQIHKGVNEYAYNVEPIWTINGKQTNNSNPADGKLTLNPDKTKETIYTAPNKIPAQNPVSIAVSFKANDSTKEKTILICNVKIVNAAKKWAVSFNYNSTFSETIKSEILDKKEQSNTSANCVMIIKGNPPEKGQTLINTGEGDSVTAYSMFGRFNRSSSRIEKDINGKEVEKTFRHSSGAPGKTPPGIEFEYDPENGGVRGIAGGGMSFSGSSSDEFWKRNIDNDNWIVSKDNSPGSVGAAVSLGEAKDVLKKTKNGFVVDFNNSKDTSYTDEGEQHHIHSKKSYHVTISWISPNKIYHGKGKKD